jgi:hypothetical protein
MSEQLDAMEVMKVKGICMEKPEPVLPDGNQVAVGGGSN